MEFFTLLLEEKSRNNMITPIKEYGNSMTHLIYVDNIIIFTKADRGSAMVINEVFKTMQKVTGLELSYEKSSLDFGRGVNNSVEFCSILNVQNQELLVRYLGILLISVNLKDKDYVQLIDNIK